MFLVSWNNMACKKKKKKWTYKIKKKKLKRNHILHASLYSIPTSISKQSRPLHHLFVFYFYKDTKYLLTRPTTAHFRTSSSSSGLSLLLKALSLFTAEGFLSEWEISWKHSGLMGHLCLASSQPRFASNSSRLTKEVHSRAELGIAYPLQSYVISQDSY